MKGQASVDSTREYIVSFVGVFVALLVVMNFVTPILETVSNVSGVPVLGGSVIGAIIGAGIILFTMRAMF